MKNSLNFCDCRAVSSLGKFYIEKMFVSVSMNMFKAELAEF